MPAYFWGLINGSCSSFVFSFYAFAFKLSQKGQLSKLIFRAQSLITTLIKINRKILPVLPGILLMVFLLLFCRENAFPVSETPEVKVNASEKTLSIFNYATPIVISVSPIKSKTDTRIKVSGFQGENHLKITPLDDPVRVLIDMFITVPGFKTVTLPVNAAGVMALRVGHHPQKVRVVLEIKGSVIPETRTVYESNAFVFIVKFPERPGENTNKKPDNSGQNASAMHAYMTSDEAVDAPANPVDSPLFSTVADANTPGFFRKSSRTNKSQNPLFHVSVSDLGPGAALFTRGVDYYYSNEWSAAISQMETLIGGYPGSPYIQKAQFLLPILYEKKYADTLEVHFRELTDRYREVLSRFPDSPFAGDAMLRMGKLYHQMKNYAEAQGYYNLALNSSPPASSVALQAKLNTAKIFRLKNKEQEAVSLLQSVIDSGKDTDLKGQAMMELAKIMYDQNAYQNSLDILLSLVAMDVDSIYRLPDVPLYMGNNHFQLGHNIQAREQLFQYYNSFPDSEENNLVLARIGDTYLRDGRIQDAVKLFLLVCKRYPGSRGANISWIRLAEQQETSPEIASLIPLSSRQIYEKVHDFFMEKNESDPLAMLAMLKLGVLYQKEKAYEQSLKSLKKLFSYKPQGALLDNGSYALKKTLESMLIKEMDSGNPGQVIATYEQEKDLIHQLFFSEHIFFVVARAYLDMDLQEKGEAVFQRMDGLLPDTEKPEDLLYFVGRRAYQDQDMDKARGRLSLLLKMYPGGKYAGDATLLMAESFFKQSAYPKAMDLFDAALKYDFPRCRRTKLLVHLAEAALKTNQRKRAMAAVMEAEKNHGRCDDVSGYLGDEIGDLFFKLGATDKAMAVFTHLVEMEQTQVEKASLKYKIGHCLERLGRNPESLALYEAVAGMDDPFWGNLAREKIAASKFADEIPAQN